MSERATPPSPEPRIQKLPYTTPLLVVHGPLSVITKAVGKTGAHDGQAGYMSKSQP